MSLRRLLLATATVLLPFSLFDARAQDAPPEVAIGVLATGNSKAKAADTHAAISRQVDPGPETIVVTSSRRAESIKQVPESVSVITAAEIRGTAAQTVDQVLRYVPSVDLPSVNAASLHPTADSVSMRGLSGTRALVLLDGIPLNDSYFGSVQWSRVPLENIRQIEIIRGGDSTLWGNYAMGGVINILTQQPIKNELLVQGGAGSYGTYRTNLYGSYIATPWARFGIDYGYNQTLGYDQVPVDIRRPIDRKTEDFSHNVAATGDFDLSNSVSAGVRVNWNQVSQPIQNSSLSNNYLRIWTYNGHLSKTFSDTSALTLAAFRSDSYFWTNNTSTPLFNQPAGSSEYVQDSHHTPVDDTGASLVWSSSIPALRVTSYSLGADVRLIEGTDYGYIFSDQTGSIQPLRTDIGRGKQLFTGGFGQVSLAPVKNLDVMFSGRYQYYTSYDSFQRNATSSGNLPSHETYSFLPRLSVRYHLTPQIAIRAAGYEAFRAPTEDQLYRSIVTSTGAFLSNAKLFPEKLKGGEAGFDFDFGRITGQVTGFYNHIDNLLTSRNLTPAELPAGAFFGSQNINAGSGESRGMELEAHYRIANGLNAILGYTYADSPITSNSIDPASVGLQQIMVPHHKVTLSINYVGANGWRITPQLRYLSKQWGDSDHTLPIDGHFVADLTGSYPLTKRVEVYGELQNLFNKTYIGFNDGASPPQLGEPLSVFGGIRIRLF